MKRETDRIFIDNTANNIDDNLNYSEIDYNMNLAYHFRKKADPSLDFTFKGKNIADFDKLLFHLNEAGDKEFIKKLLSTYLWIKNKSELSDICAVINDYDYIDLENKSNYHLKLIKNTLILSEHILKENIKSLATELWGRLKNIENSKIKELLCDVNNLTTLPWFKPHFSMNSPEGPLKFTLSGHKKPVHSVAFSDDGKYIISGAADSTIRIWDCKKRGEVKKLEGHSRAVSTVNFSHNGMYIVSASKYYPDNSIRVWKNKIEIANLERISKLVTNVSISPNGEYIAGGMDDNTIKIFDWKDETVFKKLEGHSDAVKFVAFSPDSKYIASVSKDHTLRLWDWREEKEIDILGRYCLNAEALDFSPNGKYLASASPSSDKVEIFNLNEENEIKTIKSYGINSLSFSPCGKYIALDEYDGDISLWDWKMQEKIATLEGHIAKILSLAFSPDGDHIVSGSNDGTIKLWDLRSQEKLGRMRNNSLITSLAFSPSGEQLASSSQEDSDITIWHAKEKDISELKGHRNSVSSVAFSPDGKFILSGSRDKSIILWDLKREKSIKKLSGHEGSVNSVGFSLDGEYMISSSLDKTVRVWDWKKQIAKLKRHHGIVKKACFSPDANYIVSALADTLRVWDSRNFEKITLSKPSTLFLSGVMDMSFSPDGKYLVSGSKTIWDNCVAVWNWETGNLVNILDYNENIGNCVSFSPNGRYVLSGSEDKTICLWDWEEKNDMGELLNIKDLSDSMDLTRTLNFSKSQDLRKPIVLLNTEEEITTSIFSNNGRQIAVGGKSGYISVYDIENLDTGLAIVSPYWTIRNDLNIRCSYCTGTFDILNESLGNIIECPYCNEDLKVNNFIVGDKKPLKSVILREYGGVSEIVANTKRFKTDMDYTRLSMVKYFKRNLERSYDTKASLKCEKVKLSDLQPTEAEVFADELKVRDYELKWGLTEPIYVIKTGGRYVLAEGHHRVLVAISLGINKLDSYIIEVNKDIKLEMEKEADKEGIYGFEDIKLSDEGYWA